MMVRLIPYAQVFVSVTMDLDEAAAIADALALLRGQKGDVSKSADLLCKELEAAFERVPDLQAKRGY